MEDYAYCNSCGRQLPRSQSAGIQDRKRGLLCPTCYFHKPSPRDSTAVESTVATVIVLTIIVVIGLVIWSLVP